MITDYLFALSAVTLAVVSQMLLKKSALRTYPDRLHEYLNPYVITGYALLMCSLLLMLESFRRIGYLSSILLEPLGYVLVLLAGCLFFHEKLTLRKVMGMLLILGGILLFHLPRG